MRLSQLDSRLGLGSDIERAVYQYGAPLAETSWIGGGWVEARTVRVVVGEWGPHQRLVAPELDLVAEGRTFEEAWGRFLEEVRERPDSPWMTFAVGRTTREEIAAGLNAPEDEDWCEPLDPREE